MHEATLRCTLAQILGFCCTTGIAANCPKLPVPLKTRHRHLGWQRQRWRCKNISKCASRLTFCFKILLLIECNKSDAMRSCIRDEIVAQAGRMAEQGDVQRCCKWAEGEVLDARAEG